MMIKVTNRHFIAIKSTKSSWSINNFISIISTGESIEVLRERLSTMKRLMADKQTKDSTNEFWKPSTKQVGIIDGNFLSVKLTIYLLNILILFNELAD